MLMVQPVYLKAAEYMLEMWYTNVSSLISAYYDETDLRVLLPQIFTAMLGQCFNCCCLARF